MFGKRFAGILLLSTLTALPVWSAEVPRLLADVNKKPVPPDFADYPNLASGFLPLGDRLIFSTAGSTFGASEGILWSTDGTREGTRVVSSTMCPSPCFGMKPVASLGDVAVLKSRPFYWRTDGTPAGTFPLPGLVPNSYFEEDLLITDPSTGSRILYFANEGPEGIELWRTDGTQAGTRIVKDLNPGEFDSFPHTFTAWEGRLCFVAYGKDELGNTEYGLWCTDGTAEGTRFLGEARGHDEERAAVVPTPSHLFFTSGEHGEDLSATDCTPEGTRLLHDFDPLPTPHVISLIALDGAVYFQVSGANGSKLWESDGTPGGTRPVPGFPAGVLSDVSTLRRFGGRWLFRGISGEIWTASDGFSRPGPLTGCQEGICPGFKEWVEGLEAGPLLFSGTDPAHGLELWATDGTSAGTRRLSDACPGPCDGLRFGDDTPVALGSSQGLTWFLAHPDDDDFKGDLWVTDGTPEGTRRLAEHTPSVGFLDGRAYFGLWGTDAYSSELWTADGSHSGTRRVSTLKRTAAPGSYPFFAPLSHGAVLFGASVGVGRGLWASDGTSEGTALLTGFRGVLLDDFSTNGFTRVGSSYFFLVYREDSDGASLGDELWRTDGTRSGTRKMISFDEFADTELARAWNGKYLFPVDSTTFEGPSTWSYWVSDGTPAGTREIVPNLPGVLYPTGLHLFGSRFLFVSRKEVEGGGVPQLFISDGTPAGTLQLTNNQGKRPPLKTEFVQLGRTAFFRIYGLDGQPEIWRTDGTPRGTRRAFDLKVAAHLQVFQGSLYLTAALDGSGARGLFRVDDPQGPPVLIAPVSPPYEEDFYSAIKPMFTAAGGRLFFSGSDSGGGGGGAGGRELWVTDGTSTGTKRVLDIRPGPDSSAPDGLAAAGNRVFFAADDGVHGRELWVSDGTAGGTHMVWDLNPGEGSSDPLNLTVFGDNLFFGADDGETGSEPWVLRLER